MKKKLIWISICLVPAVLLFCPAVVNQGSKDGLLLWFTVVLPALFPFMVFSGTMMKTGAAGGIGHLLYPFLHRLLGLSENGCYAMAVGFLSGYPLGAKTAADLLLDEKISYEEAQYVTGFCNNAGVYRCVLYGTYKAMACAGCCVWYCHIKCISFFAEKGVFRLSKQAKCGKILLSGGSCVGDGCTGSVNP